MMCDMTECSNFSISLFPFLGDVNNDVRGHNERALVPCFGFYQPIMSPESLINNSLSRNVP